MEFTVTNIIVLVLSVSVLLFTGILALFFPEGIRQLALSRLESKRISKRQWINWVELVPFFGSDQLRIKWLRSATWLWTLRFMGFFCLILVAFILYVIIHSSR